MSTVRKRRSQRPATSVQKHRRHVDSNFRASNPNARKPAKPSRNLTASETPEQKEEKSHAHELLGMITKGTSTIIASIDRKWRYTFFNAAYREEVRRLCGRKIAIGDSLIETFAHLPAQQKIVRKEWTPALRGMNTNKTVEFGDPGVYRRTYNVFHTPIRDSSGMVVGAGEVAYDVTEKVRAEEALRASEKRMREILEASPIDIAIIGLDGTFIDVNKAALDLHGFSSKEELIGKNCLSLVDKAYHKVVTERWQEALRNGSVNNIELVQLTKEGRKINTHVAATRLDDADGKPYALLAMVQDITTQKQSEAAIRETELNFRIVADNTYDWEFWLDAQDRFVYCSPSCERITGHLAAEFLSKPGLRRALVHPDDLKRFDEHQRTVEHVHAVGENEWRFKHTDGTWRWIAHACIPIYSDSGAYLGCRGSNRDITQRKRVEESERNIAERNSIMAEVTSRLLRAENLQLIVEDLCTSVMNHLACDCFFNFLVDDATKKLHLNAYRGVTPKRARGIEWLEPGVAVCGLVAQNGSRIVAENVQQTSDPTTALAKSLGMQAYACHPLMGQGKVLGTLSFGTKTRIRFTDDELSLMKSVADQVAIAMQRMRDQQELRKSRDELELRVNARTAELNKTLVALEAERKRFRDVLDRLPAYVTLLTEDYHIALVNKYFAERFGASDGRHCYESLFGKTEPCENCQSFTVLKTNAPNNWEWDGPDGRTYDVTDFPFTDVDGSRCVLEMGVDITDRKKAEEQIRNANMYHRKLLEASLDPLVTINPDGKITDVNAATEQVTGCTRQELIGTDFSYYFTDPERARAGYQRVFREGSVQDFALEIRHKSGRETPVLYNASHYTNEKGDIVGVFAAARDVSERRRAELQLRRTTRALRTLGRCNEVLVHAETEHVLLGDVCRIIVEEGGYRLAWVGYAEDDPEKTVCPVAYAGFEEGYLEHAHITWADTERGRGPTGSAIRTGKPAMSRNVLTDPTFAPWREEAIKRGYASSLVLPLKSDKNTFGALNIYAVEPDAFNVEEMSLLTELADDLSFGIVALRDRLEKQRAEEELRFANAYNRSLIEASLDPLVTISPEGKITDVNAATEHATGCTRQELRGTDFSNYFTEPELARAGYQRVFREGSVQDYALEIRHKSGRHTPVLYNATLYANEKGEIVGVFAAARDITDRRRVEKELQLHQQHLEELVASRTIDLETSNRELQLSLASSPALIFYKDKENRFIRVNRWFAESIGMTKAQLEGKSLFDLFSQDLAQAYWNDDKEVLTTGKAKTGITEQMETPTGLRWFQTDKVPSRDAQGNIIGVIGFSVDVTERRKLEADILERSKQLEVANKELEAFAYSVSHDLRAPLRHIDGFIELLSKELGSNVSESGARHIQTISGSAKRMASLIDDLLTFSRMSRQEMHSTKVDMGMVAAEVIDELAGEVHGRTIDWRIGTLPTVTADKPMMKLVLMNLVSNAQKFTRTRESAEIEIGTLPSEENETIFFIRDNGVGFDMEYVHKLFGVFQRLHSEKEFEGTGIGLANVRRIIDRHGGRTWAEGQVNVGATFCFSLPQSPEGV